MNDASPQGFDAAGLREWIGRTAVAHDAVSAVTASRLAATLGRERTFVPGDPLPPLWHWTLFAEAAPPAALGRDGHPALGGFLPDVGRARRMWAGGRVRWSLALRIGETARRTSTILDVVVKAGRGGPLCFVTVEHRVDVEGELRLVEEHDIVYRRDTDVGTAETVTAPATVADPGTELVLADPVLLFRYSALTFNGHRIHYDRDYATGTEGYPGLVVHGPLVATLLAGRAARLLAAPDGDPDTVLRRFDYRARAPAHDGATIALEGAVTGPLAGTDAGSADFAVMPDDEVGAHTFAGRARVAGTTIMTCTAA